ncbi:MAG: hypothetical protein LCH37_07250 [Bacteroidetes bacterium]|nr:hypothetical protein [Bacteroidota bacterium]
MTHSWSFSSVGGEKRVNLESGEDLKHLHALDQKLWTALSCPVNGLEADSRTLKLIDKDGDGQIRVPEILEAVSWICEMIANPNELLEQRKELPLSSIDTSNPVGKQLLASARIILANLGKPDAQTISLEDTADMNRIFAETKFNGDGIITSFSAETEAQSLVIERIGALLGNTPDRSGKPGISAESIVAFYGHCRDYVSWLDVGTAKEILPFGEQTSEAYTLFERLKEKVDDFFLRCQLASFNSDAGPIFNGISESLKELNRVSLTQCESEIASYPLAQVSVQAKIPVSQGLNPAWREMWQVFCAICIPGKNEMDEATWLSIKALFQPYSVWIQSAKGKPVEALGKETCTQILQENLEQELLDLVQRDINLREESDSMILVDQLIRYYRDIFFVLKNFVTFNDFYSPGKKAIFQAGRLYIDQRSCDLCIRVNDMAKHKAMASLSGMYLLYCDCTSRDGEKMAIVAALTNGDIDNLMVGRNAVFYDRSGKDWDATITFIIDNPISILQAFWTPYRKLAAFIDKQVKKFAEDQDTQVATDATSHIELQTEQLKQPAEIKPTEPVDVGKYVGIFAAISLALGAIGTALASLVAGFMGLVWWKMPLAIAGLLLLISGPSMFLAWLKLRQRNLAPLLDANGWAINARALVNVQFGKALTQLAQIPVGSRINLNDPFMKKKVPMAQLLFLFLLLGVLAYVLWMLLMK